MPPKQHDISLLFHPKKNNKSVAGDKSPRKAPAAVPLNPPKPVQNDEEEDFRLPDGAYQEFKLMSSALNGWKYDVMKFDSRKMVDLSKWVQPIKLNRKELRRDTDSNAAPVAVGPMLGPDGKPVVGADGKVVMVDVEGRPITDSSNGKDSNGKAAMANGKKRFQKKTKQVFLVPEEVRQLRKEERYPWVMEDSSPNHNEVWAGQLEDVSRSDTHAFFMPAANDVFKFVPAHRWYKFQKKLKHDLPTSTAEVESLYSKRDPQAWRVSRHGRASPSAPAAPIVKAEGTSRNSLVYSSGSSLGPGGRKLKTVDSGMNGLFDDDDDPSARRRREREYGEEGDLDEQVFEETFDDDEGVVEEENDEATKELEERLKRQYKAANKQRDSGVVESDEEEETPTMSKQAKAMQRLIRNREGNEAYDSDEEKNPYASSEEEEEEDVATANEAASQQPPPSQTSPPPSQPGSRAGSQAPKPTASPARPSAPSTESRPTSPTPSASPQGQSGHSLVAKRAAGIDKVPKPSVSRGGSPTGSRATSPVATIPASATPGTRAESPPAASSQKLKRKAEELVNGAPSPTGNGPTTGAPKQKKKKMQPVAPVQVSASELKNLLVEWLRNTPNASTRDCIHHFTPYLTDQEKKTEFSNLVREVAQLKGGVLVLRSKSTATLPAPSPAAMIVS